MRYADEIIVLSQAVQDYFLNIYRRKTLLISNEVNHSRKVEAEQICQKFGIGNRDYILFLGRLVPEKGLRYLIQVFKQVKTDLKLFIASGSSGTDGFLQEIQSMAKDDARILFTGFVQGKVLDELYSNAYLYVLPSDLKGMPLSLLEAMSYGNCCLVSDIPECADVVEDRAIVFHKGDTEELRQKLQFACDYPDRVEGYRLQAAQFICSKYNWDTVVDETFKAYW